MRIFTDQRIEFEKGENNNNNNQNSKISKFGYHLSFSMVNLSVPTPWFLGDCDPLI